MSPMISKLTFVCEAQRKISSAAIRRISSIFRSCLKAALKEITSQTDLYLVILFSKTSVFENKMIKYKLV